MSVFRSQFLDMCVEFSARKFSCTSSVQVTLALVIELQATEKLNFISLSFLHISVVHINVNSSLLLYE